MNDTTTQRQRRQSNSEPALSLALFISEDKNMQDDDQHAEAPATAQQVLDSMRQCPKFDSCSAACCPLDGNWRTRNMTRGDATCIWLREMVKEGSTGGCTPTFLQPKVGEVLQAILTSQGVAPLRAALTRAAKRGSKHNPIALANLLKPA